MSTTTSRTREPRIAIIGAGIAGLSAAQKLFAGGLREVTIFEAGSRLGGRAHSMEFGNHILEMGAQWLHGQEDNVLYSFAERHRLLPSDLVAEAGVQAAGAWCRDDGIEIEEGGREDELIKGLVAYLDGAKAALGDLIDGNQVEPVEKENMYEYFKGALKRFMMVEGPLEARDVQLCKTVFRWFILFEGIDNAAEKGDLRSISHLSYSEYQECEGDVELVNLKYGYGSLLKALVKAMPLKELKIKSLSFLQLKTAVRRIEPLISDDHPFSVKMKLFTRRLSIDIEKQPCGRWQDGEDENEEVHIFDHVIITSSLGFLKEQLLKVEPKGFFGFPLPPEKWAIIDALGFGTINKIFLYFEQPFWREEERGFQVLWTPAASGDLQRYVDGENEEEGGGGGAVEVRVRDDSTWLRSIQSFDTVRGQPNMLMAWVGSPGAEAMESISNFHISLACGHLLRRIVPRSRLRNISNPLSTTNIAIIGDPSAVYCSRWRSHPFIRGAYSNRTVAYETLSETLEDGVDHLAAPITVADLLGGSGFSADDSRPVVLFAGEATDRTRYSTTDGAACSGHREAARLLRLYGRGKWSKQK